MQSKRQHRNHGGATHARRISLNVAERQDVLDLKLLEAMERIERVRSKAAIAVGSMIAAGH